MLENPAMAIRSLSILKDRPEGDPRLKATFAPYAS
jgi:hypothetical protein